VYKKLRHRAASELKESKKENFQECFLRTIKNVKLGERN